MPTLRLLENKSGPSFSAGELLCCTYTPDGTFVLTGGWDGFLRLWEAGTGTAITQAQTGDKPVTACAVPPDSKRWLSGSSEGLLASWDAMSHRRLAIFLAHPRPISAIVFAPDGKTVATSSWDRSVIVWSCLQERRANHLKGHQDIVAGCRFTAGGSQLLSWSHDNSLRLWDVAGQRQLITLTGHVDRVTTAAVSADDRQAVSGARDGGLHLWDLHQQRGIRTAKVTGEICGCFFLPDNESLAVVDTNGRITLHSVQNLAEQAELVTNLPVRCADLSPGGDQILLACADGQVRFIGLDGIEKAPLEVTATPARRSSSVRQLLFGRGRKDHAYSCTCPACRQPFELPDAAIGKPAPCPHCQRKLRFSTVN